MSLSDDCTNIKQPYCEQRNERKYKERQKSWEDGYKLYLIKEIWDYDFEKEGTVSDCEQSFLSQMIFGHLLKAQGYNDFSVNRYFMDVNGNNKKNIRFYFDVMNNPKVNHELGKKAYNKGYEHERKIWEARYHTIGNFTPIPWPENLQRKHNGFQERWDKLLEYCKENWVKWDEGVIDISFNEYMKRTCQHLYFEEIFSDFRNKYDNKLDKITQKEWEELVQGWNNKIDEGKCIDIINFEGDIKEIVNKINFLIEARGRCIISLLWQEFSKNK